ncbi:GntR family transcriptional regulator [Acidocella sp.]|uniref:GntR family transcriptional regulator n=1 Tax=Acidocella sp. TaxID=50710 RepID=UPI003CFCDDB0
MEPDPALPLPQKLADTLRARLINGAFTPGQRLSEQSLCASLDVSRNTLREAFRLLTKEGLLEHKANRGVFVTTPSIASIIDIYRLRRMIECQALAQSYPNHPAAARMRAAVEQAMAARHLRNWHDVGSANMRFHAAIVDLADSVRLSAFYAQISAELRLSFFLLDDPELLHAPYVDMNADIVRRLETDQPRDAAIALESYLNQSERTLLAALARASGEMP